MRPDILVVSPLLPAQMEQLEAAYTLHRYDRAENKAALLADVAERIRAVVTTGGKGVAADLLDRLPNIEIVGSSGVGTDKIDLDAFRARGVPVVNTPDVLSDDVADLGIGLIISALRRLPEGHDYVRSGDWAARGMMPLTATLTGRTLGIVGLGRIGHELADRARALKMRIAYHGRRRQSVDYAFHEDLRDLARASDVLALTCPGGEETRNLIGMPELEAIGPDSWLVNLSRGSVVDEPALVAALKAGTIRGAALDVYWNEPNVDPELRSLPSVVHYPHHASGTVETRTAMSQLVVDNLAAHFAGRPLLTPV